MCASYHTRQNLFENLIPYALVDLEDLQKDSYAEPEKHPVVVGKGTTSVNQRKGRTQRRHTYLLGVETEMMDDDAVGVDVVPAAEAVDAAEAEATEEAGDEADTESISMTPSCTSDGVMWSQPYAECLMVARIAASKLTATVHTCGR